MEFLRSGDYVEYTNKTSYLSSTNPITTTNRKDRVPREFWIIVDSPRWEKFPFLFRKKSFYGQTCEYYFACEQLIKVKEALPKRWFVNLGVTTDEGIQIYD